MTGDSDFIRVVARARHRFGRRVIISGVPGSISNDLISAADGADPLVEPDWAPVAAPENRLPVALASSLSPRSESMEVYVDSVTLSELERRLIRLIDYLDRTRPYLTFLFVKTHALSPNNQLNLSPMQVDLGTDSIQGPRHSAWMKFARSTVARYVCSIFSVIMPRCRKRSAAPPPRRRYNTLWA